MSTAIKLGIYAAALVAVFLAAFGVGRLVGPVGEGGGAGNHETRVDEHTHTGMGAQTPVLSGGEAR